jgi:hypothetical protein
MRMKLKMEEATRLLNDMDVLDFVRFLRLFLKKLN